MGTVFAGVNRRGERVAVKLIHPSLAGDDEFRARFAREVAVLGRIRSSCTARVHEADAAAAQPWLATEYVPGPTLEQRLKSGSPLSGDELFGLAAGLAEALVAIHGAGVVHRDLKPTNVILSPSGPKVIDFGIARALDETALTKTGTLVGSPGWVSPEEYRGESGGSAADIYGWGVLLVYAASGSLPYGTGRPEVLALKVLNDDVDISAVPEELRDLVERSVAKKPENRPGSSEVLAGVVNAWRQDPSDESDPSDYVTQRLDRTWIMPVEEGTPWPAGGPRFRKWWLAIGLVPAVLAATAIVAIVNGRTSIGETRSREPAVAASTVVPAAANHQVSPSTASTPSGTASGKIVSWQGLKIQLPSGWGFDKGDVYQAGLLAPGEKVPTSGLSISWLGAPQANQWPSDRLDEDNGWQVGDPPFCMAPGSTQKDLAKPPGRLIRKESIILKGGYRAEYRVWNVQCENGTRFTTKAWYIPEAELALFNLAADVRYSSEYDGIIAGLDFSGWKPTIPAVTERFWGMKMTLPAGWHLSEVSPLVACVESPNTRGSIGPWDLPCPPDSLTVSVKSGPNDWPGPKLDYPIPWQLSIRSPCLAGGGVTQVLDDEAAKYNPAGEFALYEMNDFHWKTGKLTTVKLADGRRAAYRSWRMGCERGRHYTTKAWYLPVSQVALYVLSQHPEDAEGHDEVIASLDLRGLSTR
ncbi:hypothetical protein Mth01_42820 [Sphaerimonospora thailandensis]|uniref:Protein kinase domain-containing protein n=2 Tax=Sphaerimonospora thailandensis TaxID=795644 RepID=A0A8J3RC79_9ACTN|nr:hypothetical protein Mth01_42820 [Sphaerimonospora thailandensis]